MREGDYVRTQESTPLQPASCQQTSSTLSVGRLAHRGSAPPRRPSLGCRVASATSCEREREGLHPVLRRASLGVEGGETLGMPVPGVTWSEGGRGLRTTGQRGCEAER